MARSDAKPTIEQLERKLELAQANLIKQQGMPRNGENVSRARGRMLGANARLAEARRVAAEQEKQDEQDGDAAHP